MQNDNFRRDDSATTWTDFFRSAWKFSLLLVWAAWWGGLSFYALVVVPIGTDLIGSVEQGFITQRVTRIHNAITGVFVVCLLVEAFRTRGRILWIMSGTLVITTILLVVWHSHLTGMMDFQQQTVPRRFYSEHAVYLWVTAIEWAIGMAIPVWLWAPLQQNRQGPTNTAAPKLRT
jgi:hypothetical protein